MALDPSSPSETSIHACSVNKIYPTFPNSRHFPSTAPFADIHIHPSYYVRVELKPSDKLNTRHLGKLDASNVATRFFC